jgi:hypothetical protein
MVGRFVLGGPAAPEATLRLCGLVALPRTEIVGQVAERTICVRRPFRIEEACIEQPQHVVRLGSIIQDLGAPVGRRRLCGAEDRQRLSQDVTPRLSQGSRQDR